MNLKIIFYTYAFIATTYTLTIRSSFSEDELKQKRELLRTAINWQNIHQALYLDSLNFPETNSFQNYYLNPLCHAIALNDLNLAEQLIQAGANIEIGALIKLNNGKFLFHKPIMIARNNLKALELLLKHGAATHDLDACVSQPWFNQEATELLQGYPHNHIFTMNNPSVKKAITHPLVATIIEQFNAKNSQVATPYQNLKLQEKKLCKKLLTDQSIPKEIRQKFLSFFRPSYFEKYLAPELQDSTEFDLDITTFQK